MGGVDIAAGVLDTANEAVQIQEGWIRCIGRSRGRAPASEGIASVFGEPETDVIAIRSSRDFQVRLEGDRVAGGGAAVIQDARVDQAGDTYVVGGAAEAQWGDVIHARLTRQVVSIARAVGSGRPAGASIARPTT